MQLRIKVLSWYTHPTSAIHHLRMKTSSRQFTLIPGQIGTRAAHGHGSPVRFHAHRFHPCACACAYVRTCVHMRVLADAVRACVRASELARALSLRCTELAVPCAGSCGSRLGRMEQRGSGSLYPFCQCGQSCERLREYAHGKTSFQSPCLEYCHVAFQHPAMQSVLQRSRRHAAIRTQVIASLQPAHDKLRRDRRGTALF